MDGATLPLPKGRATHIYDNEVDDEDDCRCYIKSSLTGPLIEFPGTESGPKPCESAMSKSENPEKGLNRKTAMYFQWL